MSTRKSADQDDALFQQTCPACNAEITLDPAMSGRPVQCPKCLNEFTCAHAATDREIEESPTPPKPSRRLSATDRNLREQVKQLKQETARLVTRINDLQEEKTTTGAENIELQRKLESAQSALREFSESVLTLIEIQENVHRLGRGEKTEPAGPVKHPGQAARPGKVPPGPDEGGSSRAATQR